MITLEQAQAIVRGRIPGPVRADVPIAEALGLVLAEDVVATEPIPPFDNTAVDGFALRSADVATLPARLRVTGEVRAGQEELPTVGAREAVRIMTGAPIPPGADAVVMVEDTSSEGDDVTITAPTPAGAAIRRQGDDVRPGSVVLAKRTVLRAPHLGVLAALGLPAAPVYRRLRVGVLSTGDELVGDGSPLRPGQIRESNGALLCGLVAEAGAIPVDFGIVRDEEDALTDALHHAVGACDALLTSGGVSMGEYDLVKVLLDKLGEMEWMQIAIRPAKPFTFGLLADGDRKVPVFGLPGNPVSSFVSFEVLARPALRSMAGVVEPDRPLVHAIADVPIRRSMGDEKLHLVRVIASFGPDGRLHVRPTGAQGSHQLSSSAAANGIAWLPDGSVVGPGDEIDVIYLD